MSLLNLLPNAVGQGQAQISYGQVTFPVPTSFSDTLFVVEPDWSIEFAFEISNWPACHGSTLPKIGDAVLLVIDSRGHRRCVWWEGTTVAAGEVFVSANTVTAANISSLIAKCTDATQSVVIDLPPGDFDLSGTTINAQSLFNVTLRGQGSSYGGTRLKTLNSSGNLINARCSRGFKMEGIALYAPHATYTGILLDLGTTGVGVNGGTLFGISDCNFTCATNGTITNSVVDLNHALAGLIKGCLFTGGGQQIKGAHSSSFRCDAHTISSNWFSQGTGPAAIADLISGCRVTGNYFEPLFNGNGGAYFQHSTIPSNGLGFLNNSVRNLLAAGSIVSPFGDGTLIHGNQIIGSGGGATGIDPQGVCNGISIMGNVFQGLSKTLLTSNGPHTKVVYLANQEISIANLPAISSLANLGSGSIVDDAGALKAKGGIASF